MKLFQSFRHVVGTVGQVVGSFSFVSCGSFRKSTLTRSFWRVVVLSLASAISVSAAEFYVNPAGTASGDGSARKPWDLQTALNYPSAVKPGDTIWVRGGTYRVGNVPNKFTSQLAGTTNAPITVRAYPGERATIDGNITQISGGWVNYWGLEIMCSLPNRTTTESGPWPDTWWATNANGVVVDYCVSGFDLRVPGVKLINLVLHENVGGGFGVDVAATGSEIYGSLSYYNGWQGPDRGHGHGLYLQNAGPNTTRVTDSMFFENYAIGAQAYGSDSPIVDYVELVGNAFFMNGVLATSHQQNFLIGPWQGTALNPVIASNCVYDTNGGTADTYLGYTGGTKNGIVRDNYFATSVMVGPYINLTATGNSFLNGAVTFDTASYPSNIYQATPPTTGTKIMVRPNRYETGRANIIIYNWAQASTVSADVSAIGLTAGDQYELHNVQDFYGDIVTGTYTGSPITVPMTGHTVALPTSHAAPASTFPKFGAFVIVKTTSTTSTNDNPPVISSIPNQTIDANSGSGPIPFTITDKDTPITDVILKADCSNPSLVPSSAIVLGGSGTNRTVTVTPAANQTGTATITITGSDGIMSTNTSFAVTVVASSSTDTAPVVTSIADRTINANTTTGPLAFTIGDAETPADSLILSEVSDNVTLIPDANIVFGGSGSGRNVTLTPAPGQIGQATVTIGVSDGALKTLISFFLTVRPAPLLPDTAPTITAIADRTINTNTSTGPIAFTIGDAETPAANLILIKASSNTTLVPTANITFDGSGANRTVTIIPAPNQTGSSTITFTVSDGTLVASSSFTLTVNAGAANTAPTISRIADQTIYANTTTGPLAFTIGDAETPADSLILSEVSDTPALIPDGNIIFGGSGANRTVTIIPAPNRFGPGQTTITLAVSDGILKTLTSFFVKVKPAPATASATSGDAAEAVSTDTSAGPTISVNAWADVGGLSLVLANDTATFQLQNTGTFAASPTYAWDFNDGTTSAAPAPAHVFANCGSYHVTATVNDGTSSQSADLFVAVPCQLSVEQLRLKANFTRANADQCNLLASFALTPDFVLAGQTVTVNIGNAEVSFTLDRRGKATNAQGKCRLTFNKRTSTWQLQATLNKSTWREQWAAYGLINDDIAAPGNTVTLPVIVVVGHEAVVAESTLNYRATANHTGTAR